MAFSIIEVPMLVAAPTELVAIPAMRSGAAAPAVVKVKMPPAIVRLPPITLVLVPTERPILHLFNKIIIRISCIKIYRVLLYVKSRIMLFCSKTLGLPGPNSV